MTEWERKIEERKTTKGRLVSELPLRVLRLVLLKNNTEYTSELSPEELGKLGSIATNC